MVGETGRGVETVTKTVQHEEVGIVERDKGKTTTGRVKKKESDSDEMHGKHRKVVSGLHFTTLHYTHTHTPTHTYTHLHTPTHTPTHTYTHTYTHLHTHTHTHTYTRTHTYTHSHTHLLHISDPTQLSLNA